MDSDTKHLTYMGSDPPWNLTPPRVLTPCALTPWILTSQCPLTPWTQTPMEPEPCGAALTANFTYPSLGSPHISASDWGAPPVSKL